MGIFALRNSIMSSFAQQLKFFRKNKGVTQQQLADAIGSNRPVIGAYEEGRAEPPIPMLQLLSEYFDVSLEELTGGVKKKKGKTSGEMRILPIVVSDTTQKEKITLVPVKAAAGYLGGFEDSAFIESLPVFDLPLPELSRDLTYRMFQVKGDSMLPIPSGAYIICSYLEDWSAIKSGNCYVFITASDGIVYKRAKLDARRKAVVTMISDNGAYEPFEVERSELREVWKALGYVSFDLP